MAKMTVKEIRTTLQGIKYLSDMGIKVVDWDSGNIELRYEEYGGNWKQNWYSEEQAIAIILGIPISEVK